MSKKNRTPAPVVAANEVAPVVALIAELRAAPKSSKEKKSIRRKLRALGHRGGLRSAPVAA